MTRLSAITRINQALKAQGRSERLVRGRGYYYLHGGDAPSLPASAIYCYRIDPEDYAWVATEVVDLFKAGGIPVTFPS